jgi:hypothetical protein
MDLAELQNEIHDFDHDLAGINEVIIRLQNLKSDEGGAYGGNGLRPEWPA